MTRLQDASPADRSIVACQLGRPPRGAIEVAARCPYGLPLVIRTSPVLEDGTPFPTHYYLTCPVAIRDAGRLEATGFMREMNERLAADPAFAAAYRDAHDRYRLARDGGLDGRDETAGGMPGRVKCLHALYAHEAADANPVGALVRDRIEPLDCPGLCVADRDGSYERVEAHPAYRRRRTR